MGIYLGTNVNAYVKDTNVCIAGGSEASNCNYDPEAPGVEITKEAGKIGFDDKTPEVEVEVPDNQIKLVTEYCFGLWFRF
jgi:hypothetical protein